MSAVARASSPSWALAIFVLCICKKCELRVLCLQLLRISGAIFSSSKRECHYLLETDYFHVYLTWRLQEEK